MRTLSILLVTTLLSSCSSPASKDPFSRYHSTGRGLGNSALLFEGGGDVKVAFLGGSITYNTGWRDSVSSYLQKRFPDTKFTFINAGIPSMGSTPSAFRLNSDVLSYGKIDLIFNEAAVNDATNGRTAVEQKRALEGIVRQIWRANPMTDIVLMHFVDPQKMESYRQGFVPDVIENHNLIGAHYELPTVNLALEVTERIDRGEFNWEDDFINLHPSPFGQEIYARSIIAFLEKTLIRTSATPYPHSLPEPLTANSYEFGQHLGISLAKLSDGWALDPQWEPIDGKGTRQNFTGVPMLVGKGHSGVLKLEFHGSLIGIAVAAGPDAGIIQYQIDDRDWKELDLFTRWSQHLHLPWYYTLESDLKNIYHSLKIRMSSTQNELSTGTACRIRYFYVNDPLTSK